MTIYYIDGIFESQEEGDRDLTDRYAPTIEIANVMAQSYADADAALLRERGEEHLIGSVMFSVQRMEIVEPKNRQRVCNLLNQSKSILTREVVHVFTPKSIVPED